MVKNGKDTGVAQKHKTGTKIDYDKGEVSVELPYLERHDQASYHRADDYETEIGGGSSTFRKRAYSNIKSKISQAQDYYIKDSLARRFIELMAQFSATSVQLKGAQKYKVFFNQWMKVVGMPTILKKIFKEFYRSSNVHTIKCTLPFKGKFKKGEKLDIDILKGFKTDGRLGNFDNAKYKIDLARYIRGGESTDIAARKLNWSNKMIPWRYTVLNPLQIEKYGDSTFRLEETYWTPSSSLRHLILEIEADKGKARRKKLEPIIKSIPAMLYQQLKDGKSKIELFPHFYSPIYRLKDDYESDGEPLMTPIFDHLFRKNQMREADIRVINSVINKILLIRVGSDKFPAKKKQLEAISAIFQEPSHVLELIWNHCIDVKWVDVQTEFLNDDKYNSVDKDIKEGFGVTEVLLGTAKDNKGNPFVSLRGLVENMADGQESVSEWLQEEFEDIGDTLQLDTVPEPHLTTINLEDKVNLFKIYQGMVDRGILSNETVCELMGEDWRRNLAQIKKESKQREEGILPLMGSPYQKGTESPSTVAPGDKVPGDPNVPTGVKPKSEITPQERRGSQGKPVGKQGPLQTPRKSPRMKAAAEAAVLDGSDVLTADELIGYANQAVKKLYDSYNTGGKDFKAIYNDVALDLYKIPSKDIAFFISNGGYKINGEIDLNSDLYKNVVSDIRGMASTYISKWKRNNVGKNMSPDVSLSILADSWAACVPV